MFLESFLLCIHEDLGILGYLEHASILLFILQNLMAPLNFSADIIADKLNQLHLGKSCKSGKFGKLCPHCTLLELEISLQNPLKESEKNVI